MGLGHLEPAEWPRPVSPETPQLWPWQQLLRTELGRAQLDGQFHSQEHGRAEVMTVWLPGVSRGCSADSGPLGFGDLGDIIRGPWCLPTVFQQLVRDGRAGQVRQEVVTAAGQIMALGLSE